MPFKRLSGGGQFKANDSDEDKQGEDHPQEAGTVAETEDSNQERADCADTCPDDIGRGDGNGALRKIQEQSAENHADKTECYPPPEARRI